MAGGQWRPLSQPPSTTDSSSPFAFSPSHGLKVGFELEATEREPNRRNSKNCVIFAACIAQPRRSISAQLCALFTRTMDVRQVTWKQSAQQPSSFKASAASECPTKTTHKDSEPNRQTPIHPASRPPNPNPPKTQIPARTTPDLLGRTDGRADRE